MARKGIAGALIERLVRQQAHLKERIAQAKIVADGVNSPFWKAYRKMMQDKMERQEFALYSDDTERTDIQLRRLVTTITNLKMFISGPSDFEKSIEAMENKLEKIRAELDERKSKL